MTSYNFFTYDLHTWNNNKQRETVFFSNFRRNEDCAKLNLVVQNPKDSCKERGGNSSVIGKNLW